MTVIHLRVQFLHYGTLFAAKYCALLKMAISKLCISILEFETSKTQLVQRIIRLTLAISENAGKCHYLCAEFM